MLDEPGTWLYTEGGSSLPGSPESPLVGTAPVTVNGVTYDLGGDYFAILQSYGFAHTSGALPNTLEAEVYDVNSNTLYGLVSTTTDPPQFPVSLTTPFSADFGSSAYSHLLFDCTNGSCRGSIFGDMSVSLVNDSTVPEPSTWLMMAVGFAGLGLASYRKARTAAAAVV
jgi:hypothetical protein